MGFTKAVLLSVIAIAGVSYILNDPLPESLNSNIILKCELGIMRGIMLMSRLAAHLGWDEAVMYRNMLKYAVSIASVITPDNLNMEKSKFEIAGVPVALYKPRKVAENSRAVIYFHGGGFVTSDPDMYEMPVKEIGARLNCIVISVDYRRSPEHPFPAALDDCGNVTLHVLSNAKQYNIDPNRVALAGDSAGGNLAATVSIRLRDLNIKNQPKLQVLIYPCTQAVDLDTPSYRGNQYGPLLTKDTMAMYLSSYIFGKKYPSYKYQLFYSNHTTLIIKKSNANTFMNIKYLPNDELVKNYNAELDFGNMTLWNEVKDRLMHWSLSPLFTYNLRGLPVAYVVTCQHDVLRDDGIFYVQRLQDAGVKTIHHNFQNCFHGWFNFFKGKSLLEEQYSQMMTVINDNL